MQDLDSLSFDVYRVATSTPEQGLMTMNRYSSSGTTQSTSEANKIYVVVIGSAPMASLDALMLSLDRFKNMLSSESAQTQFETTIRSIQPTLTAVHAFIDAVYAQKNPTQAVTMAGRTLVVEINLSQKDFLECIHDYDVDEILSHITAVGSMPAKKTINQKTRDYTAFPVSYKNGNFVKIHP